MPATGEHTEKCHECQQWYTYPVASHHTPEECQAIQELMDSDAIFDALMDGKLSWSDVTQGEDEQA